MKKAQNGENPDIPLYSYMLSSPTPVRMYIRDEAEADEQVSKLQGPLGFDMEWRVFSGRGVHASERKTAVIQLCDLQTILIIQLSAMKGFPPKVKAVVGDKDIVKMGINILGDGRKLYRDYGVVSRGLLELTNLAHLVDPIRVPTRKMISLKRIVEMYTGYTLDKGTVQTSNWEANLSQKQLEYAANDAHSALRVYNELMRMARAKDMTLHPVVTPSRTALPDMGMTFLTKLPMNTQMAPPRTTTTTGMNRKSASTSTLSGSGPTAPTRHARFGAVPVTSLEQRTEMDKTKPKQPVRGQLLRAYKLWHEERLALPAICSALRSPENPLAKSTVITYVVEALKADDTLVFSRERLRELARLDFGSWRRHGEWIDSLDNSSRGLVN
ncbi:ribonuclease H-like domain-containing protein [Gautieria morchelliformis]|nr:ribonuclease H-like domain-containing protein [Gautieria morchelliformis]